MAAVVAIRVLTRQGQHQVAPVLGAAGISKREKSTTQLTSLKRGRGGRSSFSGIVATVFGSTGSLGRYVVNRLGKVGSQVIVPYRGEAYHVAPFKLMGDLGQILFFPYEMRDEESIRKVMKYSNVVINLTGRDYETKNYKFNDVHVDGARRIARLARESGVERLIHFSSLNASPNPQRIYLKNGSEFLQSKYAGEDAVRAEFPEAIIFRPADMFGEEDRFCRYYANHWRRSGANVPMWKKGMETVKQPVYVGNVAEGVVNAVTDPDAVGKTFDAVGPSRYYLGDLVDFFNRIMRQDTAKLSYLSPLFKLKVAYMSQAPVNPLLTMEKLEREFITDVVKDNPNLEDLGVNLMKIENRAPYILKPYRAHSYYHEQLGEFADPAPPPAVA